MAINLTDIPKDQSLILVADLIIQENDNIIKDLNYRIKRLRGIKKELLKLK